MQLRNVAVALRLNLRLRGETNHQPTPNQLIDESDRNHEEISHEVHEVTFFGVSCGGRSSQSQCPARGARPRDWAGTPSWQSPLRVSAPRFRHFVTVVLKHKHESTSVPRRLGVSS